MLNLLNISRIAGHPSKPLLLRARLSTSSKKALRIELEWIRFESKVVTETDTFTMKSETPEVWMIDPAWSLLACFARLGEVAYCKIIDLPKGTHAGEMEFPHAQGCWLGPKGRITTRNPEGKLRSWHLSGESIEAEASDSPGFILRAGRFHVAEETNVKGGKRHAAVCDLLLDKKIEVPCEGVFVHAAFDISDEEFLFVDSGGGVSVVSFATWTARWNYHRAGTQIYDLAVTPDFKHALLLLVDEETRSFVDWVQLRLDSGNTTPCSLPDLGTGVLADHGQLFMDHKGRVQQFRFDGQGDWRLRE